MPLASQYPLISSRAVTGMFFEEFDLVPTWADRISFQSSSDQAVETYAGLTNIPMFREWIGGRQLKKLAERSIAITNKDWESTMLVSVKDLRRDKTGQLRLRISELASRAKQHREKLLSTLILAGTGTTLGNDYTGTTFFSDTHTLATGAVNDNNISVDISALPTGDTTGSHGSVTAPSVGEMALTIQQGAQAFYGFVDTEIEPMNQNIRKFLIMVPTSLWAVASAAVSSQNFAQGMTNPIVGGQQQYEVIANARLNAWTDKFVMFAEGSQIKPFILQSETQPMFSSVAEGSEFEFDNGAHKYGVNWSGNVGFLAPDKAVLVTMT